MDGKLAKGLVKGEYRKTVNNIVAGVEPVTDVVMKWGHPLVKKGKLKPDEVKAAFRELADACAGVPVIRSRTLTPIGESRLSARCRRLDLALLATPGHILSARGEEKVFAVRYTARLASNHGFKFLDAPLPIHIRDHAMSRFLERSDGFLHAMFEGLFPSILACLHVAAMDRTCPFPIAIPHDSGLFLGMVTYAQHYQEDFVGTYQVWTKAGPEQFSFMPPHADGDGAGFKVVISSFVEVNGLHDDQEELRLKMSELMAPFADSLFHVHAWDRMMAYADEGRGDEWVKPDGPAAQEFDRHFHEFTKSELWNSSVRMPSDWTGS